MTFEWWTVIIIAACAFAGGWFGNHVAERGAVERLIERAEQLLDDAERAALIVAAKTAELKQMAESVTVQGDAGDEAGRSS